MDIATPPQELVNLYLPWRKDAASGPSPHIGSRYTDGQLIGAVDNWPPGYGTSPRQADSEAGRGVGMDALLDDPSQLVVYRIDPVEVSSAGEQVWEVVEVYDGLSLLGPQAEEMVAVAHLAGALVADRDWEPKESGPLSGISLSPAGWTALQELYESSAADEAICVEHARGDRYAAESALRQAGVYPAFSMSCSNGDELLAIAARDLLSTVDGWNQSAYDRMTARYRRTVAALADQIGPSRLPGPIAATLEATAA